jgi:hypothetical protein
MRCCSNAATRGCCCGARTPISLSQLASRRPLTTRSHLSSPPQALATRCCSNAATAACAWIAQSVCGARRIASAQCAVSLSLRCHAAHHTATQARNASTGARYCAGREDCICPMCRQHISPVMAAAPRRMPDVCPPLLFFPDTPLLPPLGWPRGHAAHAHLYTPQGAKPGMPMAVVPCSPRLLSPDSCTVHAPCPRRPMLSLSPGADGTTPPRHPARRREAKRRGFIAPHRACRMCRAASRMARHSTDGRGPSAAPDRSRAAM